jgi:hypothetical protein
MARRLTALIGIAIVIGLVLTLMWRVYVHQSTSEPSGEPAIVENVEHGERAEGVVEFAGRAT